MDNHPESELPPGLTPISIDQIADYLKAHAGEIDTFCVLAFPKLGSTLPNLVHEVDANAPETAPSMAFFKLGELEQAVNQFDEFMRTHMEAMPQVIMASQQRLARRRAQDAVLLDLDGRPLPMGGN